MNDPTRSRRPARPETIRALDAIIIEPIQIAEEGAISVANHPTNTMDDEEEPEYRERIDVCPKRDPQRRDRLNPASQRLPTHDEEQLLADL